MKKRSVLCILIAAALMIFSGCSQNSVSTKAQRSNSSAASSNGQNSGERIYQTAAHADWIKASRNLKSLYDSSEFVAEIRVDHPEYSVEKTGRIATRYKPVILNTYKGAYNGNSILSYGGIMKYSEYVKNDIDSGVKKNIAGDGKLPDKVQYNFAGIPIVQSGDTYLVFCQNSGSQYVLTNGYEGLFKEKGNQLVNNAIQNNSDLANDLSSGSSNRKIAAAADSSASRSNGNDKDVQFDKNSVISRIQQM